MRRSGKSLREYLELDDTVLELNVTPNRGDAMSVLGIAREVAALAGTQVTVPAVAAFTSSSAEKFPVRLEAPAGCPRFAGCIVRGVDNRAPTPAVAARAPAPRRAALHQPGGGRHQLRACSRLGQPMHAYDLAKLKGGLTRRAARSRASR